MRGSLLLFAVLLCACPPTRADDDDSACSTGVTICGTMSGLPGDGGEGVLRTAAGDDLPIQSPLDADGCTTIEVGPGSYEWSAADSSGTCISVFQPVEVMECETASVSVELLDWCMDG